MLRISNWEKWQSYRSDRGQPPWIKVHRRLMRNVEWVELNDAERGQLVAMWLLAADHDGVIPASPEVIRKLCFMSDRLNLKRFIELGFVEENGVKAASERRQDDEPKAEAKAEAEAKADIDSPAKEQDRIPFAEIISYLNDKAKVEFKHTTEITKRNIRARWLEGHRVDAFKRVVDNMVREWGADVKMQQYLRPQTLFGPKFEGYLNRREKNGNAGNGAGHGSEFLRAIREERDTKPNRRVDGGAGEVQGRGDRTGGA